MAEYRKKPVVINAVQFLDTPESREDIQELIDCSRTTAGIVGPDARGLAIETLEGTMTASIGDWIIQGVAGELYPCKPDIFELTYEKVG